MFTISRMGGHFCCQCAVSRVGLFVLHNAQSDKCSSGCMGTRRRKVTCYCQCHLSSAPVSSELSQDGEAAALRALHGSQAHQLLPLGRAWLRAAAMPGSEASSGLVPPLRTTTAAATASQPQPQPRAGSGTVMDPICEEQDPKSMSSDER